MKYSHRHMTSTISRCLLLASIITITVTMFTLSRTFTCNECTIRKHERTAIFDVDSSIIDFISNTDELMSKLEDAVKHEEKNDVINAQTILSHLRTMKGFVRQVGLQIDQMATQRFLSQPVINNHNFSYIHNPADTCSRSDTQILILLPSAVTNFDKRLEARNGSRGAYVRNETNNAKMLFFLGRPSPGDDFDKIQQKIEVESKKFGDIVQENFEDIYRHNRLKSVAMLKWTSVYCSNTKYIIRSDDDIKVNVSALVHVLDKTAEGLQNFIVGKQRTNDPPCRDKNKKYYMSIVEFPLHVFPPYLLGGLMGYPLSTVRLLYEAALRVEPIWLEDVYITGMCAPKVHIAILTNPAFAFKHSSSELTT